MADDRDKRRPRTPPPGVLAQIAPTPPETWEDNRAQLTPINPTPIPAIGRTPTPESLFPDLERRSRETKNASLSTLQIVENHRKETREDLSRLHERLDATNTRVEAVIIGVSEARVEFANQLANIREDMGKQIANVNAEVSKQGGQNTIIIGMLQGLQHEKTTMRIAEIEVDKTRQITEITDAADSAKALRKIRTTFWLKVIGIGGVVAGLIAAAIKAYFIAHS